MKLPTLKSLCLSILLFLASTLLMANVALSNPLPKGNALFTQTLVAESSGEEEKPVQPSKTVKKDSSTENDSTQQRTDRDPASTTAKEEQSRVPYDMEAIKSFNRALYGS